MPDPEQLTLFPLFLPPEPEPEVELAGPRPADETVYPQFSDGVTSSARPGASGSR